MAGVIGGMIPFILNYNRGDGASLNNGTYIRSMCFMGFGGILSLAIITPSEGIRHYGCESLLMKHKLKEKTQEQRIALFC